MSQHRRANLWEWLQQQQLLVLLCLLSSPIVCMSAGDSGQCQAVWQEHLVRLEKVTPAPSWKAERTVFLHVARTAGSTFLSCFLLHISVPEERCPNMYVEPAKLREAVETMDPPNCALLASHFDVSVMEFLPEPDIPTALITQTRDPVSRVISMYEYAVESGSRMYAWRARNEAQPVREESSMSVLANTVWPWNYLIPFMADRIEEKMAKLDKKPVEGWASVEDLEGRRWWVHKATNQSKWTLDEEEAQHRLPPLHAYDNDMAMTLEEFVRHPVAHELVHDGQTHLVLGISNITMWDRQQMAELRGCAQTDLATLKDMMSKSRQLLRQYRHVGTNEQLDTTIETAAVAFNWSMEDVAWSPRPAETGEKMPNDVNLGHAYRMCSIQMSVHASGDRFVDSLVMPDGRRIAFGKHARKTIKSDVIDYIRNHNLMDFELHAEAQKLLEAQRQLFTHHQLLMPLPHYDEDRKKDLIKHAKETTKKRWQEMFNKNKQAASEGGQGEETVSSATHEEL